MSDKLIGITPTVDDLEITTGAHTTRLTNELGVWVKTQIPPLLSDKEFAQVSAGLLIAMSRKIAECAVAFGETHRVPPNEVLDMIAKMVTSNHAIALNVAREVRTVN